MPLDSRLLAQIRANRYGRLQFLYTYPIPKRKLQPLLKLWVREVRSTTAESDLNRLKSIFDGITDWNSFVIELNAEYRRLFVDPGKAVVPTYASFYLEGRQAAAGEPSKVLSMYRGWNSIPPRLGKVTPDNIALEFAFLGHLATRGFLALVQKEENRHLDLLRNAQLFLREHVLTWVPTFCQRLESSTENDFFGWLSSATRSIVDSDAVVLRSLLERQVSITK